MAIATGTAILGAGLLAGGAALYSGSKQAGAASSAAQTQAEAADRASQIQYQTFQQQQALLAPWAQSGQQNLSRLNYAMYGQMPSSQQMQLDPNSQEYKNYVAQNPQTAQGAPEGLGGSLLGRMTGAVVGGSPTLYKNPMTGEISTTPPQMDPGQFGVQGGGLNPDFRYGMQDWQSSPEFQVYSGARDAALRRSTDQIQAQNAASGMFGSGNWANRLAENMGDIYAQYDPQSYAAAQGANLGQRRQEYNILAGMSSPIGAQQVADYAEQYGLNAGNMALAAGDAQARGQMGAANAWGNALQSGVGQAATAYGQYQGGQNFNASLAQQQAGQWTPTQVGAMTQLGGQQAGYDAFYGYAGI